MHCFRNLEEVKLTALIKILKERPKSLAQQRKNKPTCQYHQAVSCLYTKYGNYIQEQRYTLEAKLCELAPATTEAADQLKFLNEVEAIVLKLQSCQVPKKEIAILALFQVRHLIDPAQLDTSTTQNGIPIEDNSTWFLAKPVKAYQKLKNFLAISLQQHTKSAFAGLVAKVTVQPELPVKRAAAMPVTPAVAEPSTAPLNKPINDDDDTDPALDEAVYLSAHQERN